MKNKFKKLTLISLIAFFAVIVSFLFLPLTRVQAASEVIFQPSAGLNDGTDEGSVSGGKDTYISSTRYGDFDIDLGASVNFGTRAELIFDYYASYDGYPLLKFDVSTLPSDITSAKLYLYSTANCGGGSCPNMDWTVNAIASPWDEMTATWNMRPTLSGSYGTLNIPASPSALNESGHAQWVSVDITNLYNGWKNGTIANYGIGFTRLGSTWDGGVWLNTIASSDYNILSLRPKLVIEVPAAVTPLPPPTDSDGDGIPDSIDACDNSLAPEGMVGCWGFEEGSGATAADSSGNNNTGTLVNNPSWIAGKVNNGLSFSNGQYVQVPHNSNLNIAGNLTIDMWINPNSVACSGADPGYVLISKRTTNTGQPYTFYIGCGGSLHLNYWSTTGPSPYPDFVSTGTVSTGVWQHVAVTRSLSGNDATVTFYINGVAAGSSVQTTGAAYTNSHSVWISKDGYFTGYTNQGSYSGLIDEVAIYNRVLSAEEIQQHYQNGLQGKGYCEVTAPVDIQPPIITVPAPIVIEAISPLGAQVIYEASATDNVGVTSFICSSASGSTFPIGDTTVTCTASDAAGNSASASFNVTVLPLITVKIDIHPGSFPNPINPKSNGKIPVAILSSAAFNALTQINKASLTFGKTGDEKSLSFCNANGEDVNNDGLLDLVCHFQTQQANFQIGNTEGKLKGKTVGGIPLVGNDSIRLVPAN